MTRLARRDFLRAIVVVAGPAVVAGCADPDITPEQQGFFPQSVASGDPRPTSVVLWTRAIDPGHEDADQTLELVVATDAALSEAVELEGGAALELVATAEAGGCVKVRVEGLTPGTTYYYRFTLVRGGERFHSRVGRTRTAPDPEAGDTVRFAVVSCQDYGGKYFHAYRHVAEKELDFVLHLGDYVYETIGDPSFQSDDAERQVTFSAPDEALSFGASSFLAAHSLGNYRDLYRTYRSDPDLKRAHELFPFVAIPDDHEFSNDCYGAHANYTDGRENEEDFERRRAADRAWFEYMPVDYVESPASALDETSEFPEDFRVHRSFVFGSNLELVLTDLRRYRPDHVVPEDAFPGAVFLSEAEAEDILGGVPDDAVPYVDIDADDWADVRATLRDVAPAQGFDAASIAGLLSVPWINGVVAAAGEGAPLDAEDESLERGYAYHQLLKIAAFSAQGARYLVAERPFRALAAKRFEATDGASERLMGDEQRAWFVSTLTASTRTWKVWGNEYTLMRRAIDLTPVEAAPPEFRQRLLLTAEDWDGAPNERNALLEDLAGVENIVAVTGDLHAFFAGTPHADDAPETRIVELVAGSVSSTTWQTGIQRAVEQTPEIPPETALLAQLVGVLLAAKDTRPNPHVGWYDLERNGYAVVTATADTLELSAYFIEDELVATPPNGLTRSLDELFTETRFRVAAGVRELERLLDGEWKRWDRDTLAWI
jgi:alkaline phosphatase D